MWDRAVKASPHNSEILFQWLARSLVSQNYQVAQKAAMVKMTRAKDHDALFQAVTCCHLAATEADGETSLRDRELYASMAYRLLSKAASDTLECCKSLPSVKKAEEDPSSAVQGRELIVALPTASSSRCFHNVVDMELYATVLQSQGRFQEALDTLLPEGPRPLLFYAAKGSPFLLVEVLALLEKCQQWKRLHALCKQLLLDACAARGLLEDHRPCWQYGARGDDWRIWKSYVLSINHLNLRETQKDYQQHVETFRKLSPRHQLLASMQLRTLHASTEGVNAELVKEIIEYYNSLSDKQVPLRDLDQFMHKLPRSDLLGVLTATSSSLKSSKMVNGAPDAQASRFDSSWIEQEANSLKIEYTHVVSRPENSHDLALLDAFIGSCLRLYRLSLSIPPPSGGITERRCGDDAAILAAMACLHLDRRKQNHPVLCATLILEELLSDSRHNYDAQLLLIRLHIHQGAITRAFEQYKRLDIKNTQQLTLSWIFFPRLSSMYSRKTAKHSFDPQRELGLVLAAIGRFEEAAEKGTLDYLKRQEYCQLLSHCRLRSRCARSSARFLLHSEFLATIIAQGAPMISRKEAPAHDSRRVIERANPNLCDTRDVSAFPDYEFQRNVVATAPFGGGPWPRSNWCLLQCRMLHLRDLLSGQERSTYSSRVLNKWTQEIDSAKDPYFKARSTDQLDEIWPDLTTSERTLYKVIHITWFAMYSATTGQSPKDVNTERFRPREMVTACESIALDVETSRKFSADPAKELKDGNWEIFHSIHVQLEAAMLCLAAIHWMAQRSAAKGPKNGDKEWLEEQAKAATSKFNEMRSNIRKGAEILQTRLRASAEAGSMVTQVTSGSTALAQGLAAFDSVRLSKRCVELRASIGHTVEALMNKLNDVTP